MSQSYPYERFPDIERISSFCVAIQSKNVCVCVAPGGNAVITTRDYKRYPDEMDWMANEARRLERLQNDHPS